MTKEELAKAIDGTEYPVRLDAGTIVEARRSELVIVYGESDDLMEFEGAIQDEVGCFKGGSVRVDKNGLVPDFGSIDHNDKEALRDYFKRENSGTVIEALWCKESGYSWTYKTTIPHATFEVMEDGEHYCRGIVFDLQSCLTNALPTTPAQPAPYEDIFEGNNPGHDKRFAEENMPDPAQPRINCNCPLINDGLSPNYWTEHKPDCPAGLGTKSMQTDTLPTMPYTAPATAFVTGVTIRKATAYCSYCNKPVNLHSPDGECPVAPESEQPSTPPAQPASSITVAELMLMIERDNARWWKDLTTGEPVDRNIGELLCLMHSELSEAMEGHRKNLMDDKLPHRKMFEVELADAVIRILDTAVHYAPGIESAILEKLEYNRIREDHKEENRRLANGKKY